VAVPQKPLTCSSTWKATSPRNYGKSTGQYTNSSKTESVCSGFLSKLPLISRDINKGFAVSDDEIQMDLATFRNHYANSGGSVE